MTHIEIGEGPIIFDHKNLCAEGTGQEIEECKNLGSGVSGYPYCNEFNEFIYAHVKCDECKAAWKEAKEKPIAQDELDMMIKGVETCENKDQKRVDSLINEKMTGIAQNQELPEGDYPDAQTTHFYAYPKTWGN